MTKLGIVGYGRTGQALLRYARRQPEIEKILVFDDHSRLPGAGKKEGSEPRIGFLTGNRHFSRLSDMDTVVLSPGVNGQTPRFAALKEQGVQVLSELEYGYRLSKAPFIAVTGTNGKSTTTALIHHFLVAAKIPAVLCGNIGDPVIARVDQLREGKVAVAEVSSFQLEEIRDFTPRIALILNLTPDHLDRYASIEDYARAKLNIGKNQAPGDYLILNREDRVLKRYRSRMGRARRLWFGWSDIGDGEGVVIFEEGLRIVFERKEYPVRTVGKKVLGVHNQENIAAAVLAAFLMGVSPATMEMALSDFSGLSHRMQPAGKLGPVVFVNDSKATNIDSAVKSIRSISGDLVVILGGRDKEGKFSELVGVLKSPRLRGILLLGEAAEKIAAALHVLQARLQRVSDLKEAVTRGFALLKDKGGTVLLAPACASFDLFEDFEHRGRVFEKEVEKLIQDQAPGGRS